MPRPRVIRQSLWIRLTIRIFCGTYATQMVVGMVVASKYPPQHQTFSLALLAASFALMVVMPLRLTVAPTS